jgi:MFS family permease
MTTDLQLRVVISPPTVTPPVVSTTRLSWATSLFYFGMLAGLYPLTYLFQRLSLGRVLGVIVVAWGAIAMLTATVTSFRGLFVQRFFLGFAESIMPTAFMVVVSGYYTQAEQTMRQSWWYSATGGWTVIGAALNYGFARITGGTLARWQYLYLLAGAITVLFGVCCFWLPNSPASAWWFDGQEKIVAIERLRMGQMGVRCQKLKWRQISEAMLDPKVWILGIMMGAAYTVNGAVTGFGPLIVSTFGYTVYESLLLQMPLGALCFVSIFLTGYLSLKVPNIRLVMLIACCLPVIAGCAMIWKSTWSHHAATPIAGYTIIGFFAPVTSLTVSTAMANVAGASKKSYMAANIFVFYCVGNVNYLESILKMRLMLTLTQIVGPQLVKSQTLNSHYPELWLGIIIR